MSEFTEVTAKNLKELRKERGLKQEAIADVLGLEKHHISKIETGNRALSSAEASLLNLYFFDVMPFAIVGEKLVNSVLDFTEDQYRVICILASRRGVTPAVWIADQIRSYLAFNEEAKAETSKIVAERMARNASHFSVLETPKVAEDNGTEGN